MALFLRWFKTAPGTPLRPLGPRLSRNRYLSLFHSWLIAPDPVYKSIPKRKRLALLITILILYAFMVYSHQLTPFFVLMSLIPLIFLQRISYKIWWMPCIMLAMLLGWILIMTQPYLMGHTSDVLGGLGNILNSFGQNVASRVGGDPQHTFIARMRLIMPVSLWGLAFVGAISRLSRGHRDATVIVMALAPFPLFIAQPYGGEMLLRCYLFSQPSMIFLGASLFYESPSFAAIKPLRWLEGMKTHVTRLRGVRVTAIACLLLIFLGMFFFTRYGNELMDYKTYDEVNGVLYLYNVAPNKSLFVAGWNGSPWQLEDFEKFDLVALSDTNKLSEDVGRLDLQAVIQFMQAQHRPRSYIFFTRSQIATFNGTSGFPPGGLNKFEQAVQASGDFNLIYSNKDVEVFQLDSSIAAGGK